MRRASRTSVRFPNALVVGLGRMGSFHRRALQDLGYDVVSVDPDPTRGAEFSALEEALGAVKRLPIAVVATPIEALVPTAYTLAGTKKLLVEKPFAPTEGEARMLGAYLAEQGSDVAVGFVERYNPCLREFQSPWWPGSSTPRPVRFTRWSDRPSVDPALDLLTHDVDLAFHLGLTKGVIESDPLWNVEFDVRTGQDRKVRLIEVKGDDRLEGSVVDLMMHDLSPLHAMWHSFLMNRPVPTPLDAARAIRWARWVERERGLVPQEAPVVHDV